MSRIADINNLYLRKVEIKDAKTLFHWSNDKEVRRNSLSGKPIVWENHLIWFNGKLKDENCYFYILTDGTIDYGTIRLDYKEEENGLIISYSIDSRYRKCGLGTRTLELIEEKSIELSKKNDIQYLIGRVKVSNYASKKCFEKKQYLLIKEAKEYLVYRKPILD